MNYPDSGNLIWYFSQRITECNLEIEKTIKSTVFLLENLKNIVSFTRFFKKTCTNHLYTEKNGTGVTLKWKREKYILICGRNDREKGFSVFMQDVPFPVF